MDALGVFGRRRDEQVHIVGLPRLAIPCDSEPANQHEIHTLSDQRPKELLVGVPMSQVVVEPVHYGILTRALLVQRLVFSVPSSMPRETGFSHTVFL